MSEDRMRVKVLPGGIIKLTSDPISAPNHANAEEFFRTIARKTGGESTRERRPDAVSHHHHDHDHSHEDDAHQE